MKQICAHFRPSWWCWRGFVFQSFLLCDLYKKDTNCVQAYDCKRWTGGEKSLSHCRHFWLRASTLNCQTLPSTFYPLLTKFRLYSHGRQLQVHQVLFCLLRPFFSFDYPAQLLRTSTFPMQWCTHYCLVVLQRYTIWRGREEVSTTSTGFFFK